jgi:UDP-N-acetylglucosamine--N-acetylmuramyl-(pentapeptide) pyrophosphoryl-undecaprenol N-acetylglucosamine transferase
MDEENRSRSAASRVLLAGGGSGGHVFPALAVGEELGARGWSVHWAGRAGSMEEELVRAAGLPFHAVAARAVVGSGPLARLRALGTLAYSTARCRSMVRRLDPRVVVGTGGYVSVPVVLGARRPSILLEPNARAGVANRFLSRWARGAAVAHPSAAADLRCPGHLTGVAVRRAFFEIGAAAAPPPLRVLVLGGSQGARQLNALLPAACALVAGEAASPGGLALEVLHQVGGGAVESARQAWAASLTAKAPGVTVEVTPFIDDVASALARAQLVISRAGAITVAEICAAGRASILVPLDAAGAHQLDNARAVEAAGAAVLLAGETATPDRLAASLKELAAAPGRLATMGHAARSLARPDASRAIADLVEAVGGGA